MTARFQTVDGIFVPAVTAAQMREVDRVAVEETGPRDRAFSFSPERAATLAAASEPRGISPTAGFTWRSAWRNRSLFPRRLQPGGRAFGQLR
jgi:hypothetical protein